MMELVRCESLQANNNNKKKLNLMLHGSRGPLQSVSRSSNYYDAKTILHNQPLLVDLNDHEFNIVGSCDGLLLVVATTGSGFRSGFIGGSQVIYIWNPTTGEYKTLPQLKSHMKTNIVYGFGPDLTTDNSHYKVLLLETVHGETESEFEVNMYTTHTNSWKTLPKIPFCYSVPHPRGMTLAYDNLHYQAEIDTTHEVDPPLYKSIISFDLKDDKFRVLPSVPGLLLQICTLNGDLCAFSHSGDDYNFYCIRRMENFGVKNEECWTEICSIDRRLAMDKPITFVSPLHFLEDGQILFYARPKIPPGQPFIVVYNTDNKKASFLVQGNGSFMSIPIVYEESFIAPNVASTAEEEPSKQLKHRRTYMEN